MPKKPRFGPDIKLAYLTKEDFPPELFTQSQLEQLSVKESTAKGFPGALSLPNLTSMTLTASPFSALPASFAAQFPKLHWLTLEQMPLRTFPAGLLALKNLTIVGADELDWDQAIDALAGCPNLENVHITGVPFGKRVPPFWKLTQIDALALNECSLTDVPAELGALPKLDALALVGNQIRSPLPDSLVKHPKLRLLFYKGNPNIRSVKAQLSAAGSKIHT